MDVTDRIYLLYSGKQYRGDVPSEIGELKISKQDTLITLKYNGSSDHGGSSYKPTFFAHADGYFDLVDLEETNPAQTEIVSNIRTFSKKLKVLKSTAKFYESDEHNVRQTIPAERLRETIEATIIIDRYKNTIDISVNYMPDFVNEFGNTYPRDQFKRQADLKKVTLFN